MNFTPDQHAAITGGAARLCVDAGAGSGKTRVLVERIVHLVVAQGVPLEQIAAITFTEKAAAEMKARLRKTFRARAQAAIADPGLMSRWRDLEHRVDAARISTIHSFCAGLLREHALYIGIDPDFTVLAETETALMLADSVRTALVALLETRDEDALLLTAEYGTGPLRGMLEQMLRRASEVRQALEQIPFDDAEALYAAWEDMIAREQRAALKHAAGSAMVLRFLARLEGFAGQCEVPADGREVLRVSMLEHLRALRRAPEREIKDHLAALTERVGATKKKNWLSEEAFEGLKACQEAVKKFAEKALDLPEIHPEIDRRAADLACALRRVYGHVQRAWDEARRMANGIDFDTLIQQTLHVLRENEAVRVRAAGALRHLLIDEFQDTDRTQLEIARLLCTAPDGPHFFFVGDPKQSIYNFRGAEVELFREEREATETPIPLRENFRTLPELISFINYFFDVSSILDAVGSFVPMGAGRQPQPRDPYAAPRVEALVVAAEGEDGEKRGAEEIRREEARMIAARIRQLCAPDAPPTVHDEDAGGWRAARPGDIALLFRSTSSLYLYEEALRTAGIDFIATAGSGFHRRQEILDVINLLRVIVNPRDAAALAAFLRSPIGCMSDEGLLLLAGTRGLLPAFLEGDAPESLSAADAAALARARTLLDEARAGKHALLPDLLAWIYERTQIEAMALDHHYGLQKASNLRKLLALAVDFSAQGRPTLERFVRYLAQVAENEALREGEALMQPLGSGAVTLMTIHKSKGLEFPVVFVCDMGQGQQEARESALFLNRDLGWALRSADARGKPFVPAMAKTIATRQANRNEAESARLLYVAMTRARDVLLLCGKEKPGKGSWFAMLDGVWPVCEVADGASFSGAWGGLAVRRALASAARPPRAEDSVTAEALGVALASAGRSVPDAPAPQVLSITRILDLIDGVDADADAEEPELADDVSGGAVPRGDDARRRGTLIHALFERWDFTQADAPIEETLRDAAIGLSEVERLRDGLVAVAARARALPGFAALAEARRIHRELPFTWRVGEHLVRGTIDALVDDVLIVDYKTGRRTPGKDARYTLQLQLYALALDDIDGEAPRGARLIYLDDASELAVDCSRKALQALRARLAAVLGG